MSRFKTKLKNTYFNFLKIGFKYTDDIFAVVDKDFNSEVFVQNLNLCYPLIKLMYEHYVKENYLFWIH